MRPRPRSHEPHESSAVVAPTSFDRVESGAPIPELARAALASSRGTARYRQGLAAGFLLYDLRTGDWSAERLDALAIDRSLMPDVLPWGSPLGRLRPRAARDLGLPQRCTMIVGSFDTSCAAVGSGAVVASVAALACGSWESLVVPARRPKPGPMARSALALGPTSERSRSRRLRQESERRRYPRLGPADHGAFLRDRRVMGRFASSRIEGLRAQS